MPQITQPPFPQVTAANAAAVLGRSSGACARRTPPSAADSPSGQVAYLSRRGVLDSVVPILPSTTAPRKPHPSCPPRLMPNASFVSADSQVLTKGDPYLTVRL